MADEDGVETADEQDQKGIKDLRRAAEEGKAAKAALEAAQRENAFLRAGVDVSTPVGSMLLKAYDGELTAEAIKAQAEAVGAVAKPAAPVDVTNPADVALQDARKALTSGDPNVADPNQPQEHPWKVARTAFEDARGKGLGADDAMAEVARTIREAQLRGDERVVLLP